ncbi:MAG: helix-turn-helix domain-containing protein [Lentisphaerae bacterium]|nr:MAG: helix-turn-helix domain-containing protein [Lentisphaerota bacterium]
MIIQAAMLTRRSGDTYCRSPEFSCWTLWCLRKGRLKVSLLEGNSSRKISDQVVFSAPSLILLHPHIPVKVDALQSTQETHVYFEPRPDWIGFLQWGEAFQGCQAIVLESYSQIILDVATEIVHYYRRDDTTHRALALNALERLFLLVDRINPNTSSLWDWDDRIKAALRYLDHNLDHLLHVEEIARAVGMSPSHLAHLFKAQTGYSPIRLHLLLRIEKAKQLLLTTNRKVRDIAAEIGFVNPYHFSTCFRSVVGKSPVNYRKNPMRETALK